MAISNYITGHNAILYWAEETASYPDGVAAPAAPAFPTPVKFVPWADVPQVTISDGSREIYGLGSTESQGTTSGGRDIDLSGSVRIADNNIEGFLRKCFYTPTQTGFGHVPDLCLVTGISNVDATGDSRALRFAKCNGGSIAFNNGSAADITAQLNFMALAEEIGSPLTPSNADRLGSGQPLNWHHVTQVMVNGVNVRNELQGCNLTWNHNLERKTYRPDYGPASVWSRTTTALLPRAKQYRASLQFHSPDAAAYILGLTGTGTLTSSFSIVVSDAGTDIQGTTARTFTFTGGAGRIATRGRNGGDPANELMSSVDIILNSVRLT